MLRKIFLTSAVAAGLAVAALAPANAMTITAPAAVAQAAGNGNVTEAAYVCRRYWRHGYWHRRCYWQPTPYAYYGWGWRRHHHRWHHWR